MKRVGSGWLWLVIDENMNMNDKKLRIITTLNNENPITYNYKPILCCDIWEHAYYLEYTYDKKTYIESFLNMINWELVNNLYEEI